MPAFKALVEGPLVVRSPKRTRGDVRQELGLKEDDKVRNIHSTLTRIPFYT